MAIYRMTKEEVAKRSLLVEEDTAKLKECRKIAASDTLVRRKLIEELQEVSDKLTGQMRERDLDKAKQLKELEKQNKKERGRK